VKATLASLLLLLLLLPSVARANPHALPYSYPYATLPDGELEIEQYVDLTPVPSEDSNGNSVMAPLGILTTEVEYGITDKLELGLYLQFSDNPGSLNGVIYPAPLNFDGVKQRLRYRLANAGEWPVDVSIYGEVAELQTEVELEGKINLEKDFGRLQVLVNLWGEREFYFSGRQEWVANPTAGASWQITPSLHLGLEYWMHAEFSDDETGFNPAPHHFIGPAFLFQSNHFWVAAAPYLRLDRWSRSAQLGDEFGQLWVRTIIGIEF
jgi:hypothetical protein